MQTLTPMRMALRCAPRAAIGLALSQAIMATAAPSQWPLIYRADAVPSPNVMLTLDDSGSMTYQYLPERPFKMKGPGTTTFTVNFPNDAKVFLHYRELSRNMFSGPGDGSDRFYVTAVPTLSVLTTPMQLIQVQMRSPQVNGMYYNPEITYSPWKASDGQTSYRTPEATHAWLSPSKLQPDLPAPDPATDSEWVDLTQDTVVDFGTTSRWYCSTYVGEKIYDTDPKRYNYSTCNDLKYSPALTYSPALVYILPDQADPNQVGNYQLLNINTIGSDGIVRSLKRTDCPINPSNNQQVICSKSQELQNYTNWFVFSRSRLMTAQGAIPLAFASMSDNLRVGWSTIHQGIQFTDGVPSASLTDGAMYYPDGQAVSGTAYPSKIVQQSVRPLSNAHKAKLTNWMRSLLTYGGTPSKDALWEVGQYFTRPDRYGPWASDPTDTSLQGATATQLGCRRNYNIMITDGYYRASSLTKDNIDNTAVTGQYTPADPFKDDNVNTLADFAMYFWSNDLRSDLNGDSLSPVVVPSTQPGNIKQDTLASLKSDPATWRHLTQFMIGLGVSGNLVSRDDTDNDNLLWQLSNCKTTNTAIATTDKQCWPSTVNEIDDLWHAAINTRGKYYSVKQADTLKNSLANALTTASESFAKVAGVATASRQLIDGNIKYVPQYQAVSWTGNVIAQELDGNGDVKQNLWNATDRVPLPDARQIVVWDTVAKAASNFKFSEMSQRSKTLLGTSGSAELVSYLRGTNNANWTQFKSRNASGATLPDFVNSPPLFVRDGVTQDYTDLPTTIVNDTTSNFNDYVTKHKNKRANGVLFIGGNGGMLHAFSTSGVVPSSANDGREVFAFAPEASLPRLATIAQPNYGSKANFHQYFVDGPLIEADAYFQATSQTATQWNNVLVGTMGAGGRAVFALVLDRDNPTALSGSSIQWETTSNDMGYITSSPQVGVLPDGSWKVFVGNGEDSPSGTASLLMIDMKDGSIQAVATDATIQNNGLGGVALYRNKQGVVLGAYAGDSRGNVWRFEFQNGAMKVGYGGIPLFKATTSSGKIQPIVAPPTYKDHPNKGQIVVVNTGKLLTMDDSKESNIHSAYGIWDRKLMGENTQGLTPPTITRDNLQEQTVSAPRDVIITKTVEGVTTSRTQTFYKVSANQIDWTGDNNATGKAQSGWLIDLIFADSAVSTAVIDHPKAIYAPSVVATALTMISSVLPASGEETCTGNSDGKGFSLIIDPLTGGKNPYMRLDTNHDGKFDGDDLEDVAAFTSDAGVASVIEKTYTVHHNNETGAESGTGTGTGTGTDTDTDTTATKFSTQTASGSTSGEYKPPCPSGKCIKKPKDRVWRQLLNPPTP